MSINTSLDGAVARERRGGLLRACLAIFTVAALSNGCASNPATGGTDFVTISEAKEIEIGQQMHPQVMAQYRAYEDAELQAYVDRIGQKIAANSDRPNLTYTFTVLDSDEVNAFATPGGFIYLSRGLIAYLNSEAELAAVLGHEIGHVTARHAVRQGSRKQLLGAISILGSAAAGGLGSAATNLLGGAYISGYGRELELEADREGAEYLVRSGYASEAVIDVVRILKNQELFEMERAREEGREPRVYHGIFATHPDNDKRLREAVKAADSLKEDGAERPDNRTEFLQAIDGLVFGKVGAGGVISEDEFRHARMGIGLQFPKGWSIDQSRGRLESYSPDRQSLLIVSRQPLREPLSPLIIMTQRIGLEDLQEGRTLRTEGADGYTAVAPRANSPYGKRPVRYGVFTDDNYAYVIAGANNSDQAQRRDDFRMLNTIKSFRRLDGQSQRSAQVPRVTIVEANEATTMKRLATASPLTEFAEQRLRLLNDLYPGGEPQPKQYIKIID